MSPTAKPNPATPSKRVWQRLAPNSDNGLLWILAVAAIVLLLLRPQPPLAIAQLVDWQTIGALAGLLIVTKGIESSGALQTVASRVLERVGNLRVLALMLTALAAALSAVVTNDVCLFLLVPLTRALAQRAELPLARIVALEALAVNAGSALTPIGNPQNLFLWQFSKMDFASFVVMMLPTVAIMLGLLLPMAWFAVPKGSVSLRAQQPEPAPALPLLWTSAGLFLPFVLALNFDLLWPALLVVAIVFLLAYRRVLMEVDWTLLPIISLMFVDMRLLAGLPAVSAWLASLPIAQGLNGYLAGVATSQVVSNVPAAILLAPYVKDLPALAAGVSIGGFGLFIGSLANLIALRLSGAPHGMRILHVFSIPFLLVCGAAVAVLQ